MVLVVCCGLLFRTGATDRSSADQGWPERPDVEIQRLPREIRLVPKRPGDEARYRPRQRGCCRGGVRGERKTRIFSKRDRLFFTRKSRVPPASQRSQANKRSRLSDVANLPSELFIGRRQGRFIGPVGFANSAGDATPNFDTLLICDAFFVLTAIAVI